MKNTILAALIALGGATAIVPQTQAASLTITTDDGARYDNGHAITTGIATIATIGAHAMPCAGDMTVTSDM